MSEQEAKTLLAEIEARDPAAWKLMFGKEQQCPTWTAAALSDFKDLYDKLSIGRLRWVLSTSLPLHTDFGIRLNGELVQSSKENRRPADRHHLRLRLDPWRTPTAAFVRPQVGHQIGHPGTHGGFGFETMDRQTYYDSTHPQTIAFEIASEVANRLTDAAASGARRPGGAGRAALFPQVLAVVQAYVRERVDLRGLHPCEIGLQTYAEQIVGRLLDAITPDATQGEPPLLPRLNRYRPIGGTGAVHFKTARPVQPTAASHLNYVACHTGSWEQAAMFQLERLARDGPVACYARNYRLELTVPWEQHGAPRAWEPDFLVRLRSGVTVVLEVKGAPDPDADAKHQAARRWVHAVNNWGKLGQWDFLVCRDPQRLGDQLAA